MKSQGKPAMENDLDLKWDKAEQAFIDQITKTGKKRVEKPDLEEYLNFLEEIGVDKVNSPIPRLKDKQFVL
jgi:uncharacterized Fe-S center protein